MLTEVIVNRLPVSRHLLLSPLIHQLQPMRPRFLDIHEATRHFTAPSPPILLLRHIRR